MPADAGKFGESGGSGAPAGECRDDQAGAGRGRKKGVADAGKARAAEQAVCPIVGIGGSAGSLEALQEFFTNLPGDTDCSFVVVTHMHREHTSMLPELLSRTTSVPVIEAADGMRVESNHIYVAPPSDNLTIAEGTLRQHSPDIDVRLPIDYFLRALAADQHESSACVILSGTGTDGTIGMRAIKGEGGMAMVQAPATAKFAGMPASAEATGLADFVLPPGDMPSQLIAYVDELRKHPPMAPAREVEFPPDAMNQILGQLRARTGSDFRAYKPNTIRRRIERRMHVHRIRSPQQYARFLRENKHEAGLLFRELLITVTSFFRDPVAFDAMAEVLCERIGQKKDDHGLRIWAPGCATGEEAFSIAILVDECIRKLERPVDVQIFATDLDARAIDAARAGVYASGIAADVSAVRLQRYFLSDHDTFRISKEIREMVVFAPHNVLSDPPFTRLDAIVCRNLLIYFDAHLQRKLLPTFHYALRPGGLLFLGPSETVGAFDGLFECIDRRWKIFRRKDVADDVRPPMLDAARWPALITSQELVTTAQARPQTVRPRGEGQIQRALLAHYAPTTLVVEENGDIAYIHGRTGLYLEPAEGGPNHNVVEMAREGLKTTLSASLRRAAQQKGTVTRRNISVKSNGEFSSVNLSVTPLTEPEPLRGLYLVALRLSGEAPPKEERPRSARGARQRGRVPELEDELRHTRESLQSTVEELESANEELRSANEELQSMNEELQSANEELETSKEEMQSLNEELSTVNAELNSKIDELSHTNDDMQNLLNGIDVATVFLDNNLRVKRYTEQARELIHLVPGDAGRPLADLALHAGHDRLIDDCRAVLDTLERREEEVQAADGTWLMMRIVPYRTSQNLIDGIVLTFVPIDRLKRAEQGASDAREFFEDIVETVREPLVVLDGDLRVRLANRAFYHVFHDAPKRVAGRHVYELGDGQWKSERLRELLEDVLPRDNAFTDFEVAHDFPRIGRRRFLLNARRLQQKTGSEGLILLAMEDVTGRTP